MPMRSRVKTRPLGDSFNSCGEHHHYLGHQGARVRNRKAPRTGGCGSPFTTRNRATGRPGTRGEIADQGERHIPRAVGESHPPDHYLDIDPVPSYCPLT